MRFKTLATALATVVLATVLAPIAVSAPVQAQTQTDWHVNDSPTLFGPNQYWYWGDPGHGYGSNYYRYTYAIGGESTADNWARWNMGSRVGRQEIQVYVPSNHATATVNYNITIGGSTYKRAVAQRNISGWHSLGNWNTNGSEVVIAVYDNDASQHHERDGLAASRIGVDAIRMRCVSNCGSTAPTTTTTQPLPDPRIEISLGDNNSGSDNCPYSQLPCRWINITLKNFPAGSHFTRCVWLHSESGAERVPISGNINHGGGSSANLNRYCSFNVREGRSVWVTVGGVRSNTLRFSGDPVGGSVPPPPPIPPPQDDGPPGPVRNLRLELTDDSSFRATWDRPSDVGGSQITNYVIRVSRPRLSASVGPWSNTYERTSRSFTLNGRKGATYTVRVAAENQHGSGSEVHQSITTPSAPSGPGKASLDVRVEESSSRRTLIASWEPPADTGDSAITGYTVTISRQGRMFGPYELSASSRTYRLSNARFNTRYTVRVVAENRSSAGPGASVSIITGAPPNVRVEQEGRPWYWLLDDPDAIILWDPVTAATGYILDWRYMDIETNRLRDIYHRLQRTGLSEGTRERLSNEAASLLEGKEVQPRSIEGDSRPDPNGGVEVRCSDDSRGFDEHRNKCVNFVTKRQDSFNPDDLSYRIHSNQEDKVLQVRVRAVGSDGEFGPWSNWAYHPNSRFNAGCTALDIYNTIRNINTAVDAANVVLTIGGVVAAVFTAGSSVLATQGARAAIVFAAKEIVKRVIRDVTIKRFFVNLVRNLAKQTVERASLELAGFTFGCLVHGADLSREEVHDLGGEIISELRDSAVAGLDWDEVMK